MGLNKVCWEQKKEEENRFCVKSLKKAYACCEEHGEKEELLAILQEAKKFSWIWYEIVIRELLAWFAKADDMESFLWLLDQPGDFVQFSRGVRGNLSVNISSEVIEEIRKEIPDFFDDIFLTEKEAFLDAIVRKIGISRMGNRIEMGYFSRRNSDVPESYMAVVSGNMKMTEYFRSRKGYGTGVIEWGDIDTENGWIKLEEDKTEEILTAALMSGSERMVEHILKHFPELPWNWKLKHYVLNAKRSIAQLILQYHPETFQFVDFYEIFKYRNSFFLEAYLETSEGKRLQGQERMLNLKELKKDKYNSFHIVVDQSEEADRFYEILFNTVKSTEEKRFLLSSLFSDYMKYRKEVFLEVFLKYRDVEEDFKDYLFYGDYIYDELEEEYCGYIKLCELTERKKAGAFPVNIHGYDDPDFWKALKKKEWKRIFTVMIPAGTGEPVSLNTAAQLIGKKDSSLVQLAIEKGFLPVKMISELLQKQKEFKMTREIRMVLMKSVEQTGLKNRYEL